MLPTILIICASATTAPPPFEPMKLLQTFRSEFIAITPGRGKFPQSFQMGHSKQGDDSRQPVHRVTFSYDFQIAKYEVPQNLWQAVMGSNPSRWKGPRNSVEMLSFRQAQQFCEKVTRQMRAANLIQPNQIVRLPSEAEWEYVARAGTTTIYSFGDNIAQLDAHAWHTGNAKGNDPPVGAKKPNPWGLYDMHGYLREWCLDTAHADYQGAPIDGSAWTEKGNPQRRIIRGGSWKDNAEKLTSSYRQGVDDRFQAAGIVGADAELRDTALGLRCVLATATK